MKLFHWNVLLLGLFCFQASAIKLNFKYVELIFPGYKTTKPSLSSVAPLSGYFTIDTPILATLGKTILFNGLVKLNSKRPRLNEAITEILGQIVFESMFAPKMAIDTFQHPDGSWVSGGIKAGTRELAIWKLFGNNRFTQWLKNKYPEKYSKIEFSAKLFARNIIAATLDAGCDFIDGLITTREHFKMLRKTNTSIKFSDVNPYCIKRLWIPVAPAIPLIRS